MWLVRLTPSPEMISAGARESIQTIPSDDVEDFFKHPSGNWNWETVDRMMAKGTIVLVEIDFIPTTLGGDHAGRQPSFA